jgi:hypothetical protein
MCDFLGMAITWNSEIENSCYETDEFWPWWPHTSWTYCMYKCKYAMHILADCILIRCIVVIWIPFDRWGLRGRRGRGARVAVSRKVKGGTKWCMRRKLRGRRRHRGSHHQASPYPQSIGGGAQCRCTEWPYNHLNMLLIVKLYIIP